MCHYHVWHSVGSHLEWIGIGVRKYLTEYYFLSTRLITFCWGAFHCMPWSFSGKRWPLTCKEDWLTCSTWSITCMLPSIVQHMNYYSRAVPKNSSHAVHESWLVCHLFHVTRVFWLESWQKLKNTCVFTTCECHLRCELYCRIKVHINILVFL